MNENTRQVENQTKKTVQYRNWWAAAAPDATREAVRHTRQWCALWANRASICREKLHIRRAKTQQPRHASVQNIEMKETAPEK
jgi:hypothetical protein